MSDLLASPTLFWMVLVSNALGSIPSVSALRAGVKKELAYSRHDCMRRVSWPGYDSSHCHTQRSCDSHIDNIYRLVTVQHRADSG
jgi:hypothetical protein